MTVTTAARGASKAGSSATPNSPSSTSDSATRLTVWPSSSANSWAVSASITSLICAMWPCFINSLITSTARSAMRLASSWMVMVSGMVTSRTSFSFGSSAAWPFSRCTRRRNAATERSRSSSALSAVTRVSRPRLFGAALRVGLGAGAGRTVPPGPRRVRGASSSSGSSAGRAPTGLAAAASSPKRFFASCSALSLVSNSCLRRLSSSALRNSAALRSSCSADSRDLRISASSSAILRSSASRKRASPSARARAVRSSSVRVRSTTPEGLGAGVAGVGAGSRDRSGGGLAVGRPLGRGSSPGFRPWPSIGARLFTFSTTTALVRPWLKLWRTTPCSMPRPFRLKALVGATLSFFSPVFSVVSAIPISILALLAMCRHTVAA